MRNRVAVGLALAALCLAVVVSRAVWEGRGALASGDTAAARGDHAEAIAQWRRAARWYAPLAPHVDDAYERLESLAVTAEARGDTATALAAWRGVRGSVLATRSFFVPHRERLQPANDNIARLMAAVEGPAADPGKTVSEREAWHYQRLARDNAPSIGWAVFALGGLAMWIGGGFLFALRGLSETGQLIRRPSGIAGALVGVGLVIWLLGLYNA